MNLANRSRKLVDNVRRFHADESGEAGALGNVMYLAIAALVVVVLFMFGKQILDKLKEFVNWLIGGNYQGQGELPS